MRGLPYEIVEAMIQCFGRSFYYKDQMEAFLLSAGVDKALVRKYRDEYKFTWARKLLSELAETEDGALAQRRLLTALCNLRDVPDSGVPDRDAALGALRALKELALSKDIIVKKQKEDTKSRTRRAEESARVLRERAAKLSAARVQFLAGVADPDRQAAGYSLEDLLNELFALFEIEYRKPYRTPTQQIDGHFRLDGFDYLVEAKWRKDMPTEAELLAFQGKVNDKLESTRGLFMSIQGFRDEVARKFDGGGANIILMDGQDLTLVLEGRVALADGLRFKIVKAAQEGRAFVPFHEMKL
ncbi:MAG: restriction endonuclease [Planctomycetes bacterium]|nr:restriction endonuclease [Planctomycetota bacterium]